MDRRPLADQLEHAAVQLEEAQDAWRGNLVDLPTLNAAQDEAITRLREAASLLGNPRYSYGPNHFSAEIKAAIKLERRRVLTDDDKRLIKSLYADGGVSLRALGRRFGVHNKATYSAIRKELGRTDAAEKV